MSVPFHEASLTKIFIAAWENYPRMLFAALAMLYSDFFGQVIDADGSFIEKQCVCSS